MTSKTIKYILCFVLLAVAALALAGGYTVYIHQQEVQMRLAEQKKLEEARKEAVKEYEDLLSGFVKDVSKEVRAYKSQRMILRELVRPHNYSVPEYAKQNYEEFKNQIRPSLEKQSQRVLNVFDLAGAKLDQILENKPDETRLYLQTKWAGMKDREYETYKDFFEADTHVLEAYEELIRFYFVKAKSYEVVDEKFIFRNSVDEKAEQDLLKIIKDMQKPDDAMEVQPEVNKSPSSERP